MNALEQLSRHTIVVADTGEINAIAQYRPRDATTNPTLILKAAQMPEYDSLFQDAIQYGIKHGNSINEQISLTLDKLFVNFGVKILNLIPGRVSTEVDARYSFDTDETVKKAKFLISLYESEGIGRERVLIKIASTWEGIKAVEILEKEGIKTNSTLLFSYVQALAVAQAGGTLISPFVGRITDWYKKTKGVDGFGPENDPGVGSVKTIFDYLKKYGYQTEIMGASFRTSGQIIALAGCDLLTISPDLLQELQGMEREVPKVLNYETKSQEEIPPELVMDERLFRWLMNEDDMATEKLAEGIRLFNKHMRTLEEMVLEKLNSAKQI